MKGVVVLFLVHLSCAESASVLPVSEVQVFPTTVAEDVETVDEYVTQARVLSSSIGEEGLQPAAGDDAVLESQVAALRSEVVALNKRLEETEQKLEECSVAATTPPLHIEDKNATDIFLDVVRYCRRKGKQVLDTAAEKSSPHVARAKKAIAMAARDAARLAQSSNNRAMVVARGLYKEELVPRANIARTRAEAEWEVFVAHAKHAYDVHVEPALTGGEAPIYVNVILPAFEKNIRPLYPDYVEPFLNDVRSKAQPFVDEHAVPLYASVREYVVPLFDLKLVPFYRENLRDGVRIVWMKVEQSMDEASKVVAGIPYSAKKYLEVWVDAVDRVLRSAKVQAPKIASIAWAKVGPQYVMGIHNFEDFVGSSAERAVKWSLAWIIAWAVWNLGPLIIALALSAVVHAVWTCLFFVFLIGVRVPVRITFEALSMPFRLLTWPFRK
jgi:hypothetical protein